MKKNKKTAHDRTVAREDLLSASQSIRTYVTANLVFAAIGSGFL